MAEQQPIEKLKGLVDDFCARADRVIENIKEHVSNRLIAFRGRWIDFVAASKDFTNEVKWVEETSSELLSLLRVNIDLRGYFVGLGIAVVGIALLPASFIALTGAAATVGLWGSAAATVGGFALTAKDAPELIRRGLLKKRIIKKLEEMDEAVYRLRASTQLAVITRNQR